MSLIYNCIALSTMIKLGLTTVVSTLTMVSVVAAASASTVTFGPATGFSTTINEPQVEGDIIYQVVSGMGFITGSFGNPPASLITAFPSPDDVIEFFTISGVPFTFDSFDFASFANQQSDRINFIGEFNSVDTQRLLNFSTSNANFSTQNPNFSAPIDKLRIEVVSGDRAALLLDNLVLTPITEPSTIPEPSTIFGIALVGFGALSRILQRSRSD
jgi:hypothetical protein